MSPLLSPFLLPPLLYFIFLFFSGVFLTPQLPQVEFSLGKFCVYSAAQGSSLQDIWPLVHVCILSLTPNPFFLAQKCH